MAGHMYHAVYAVAKYLDNASKSSRKAMSNTGSYLIDYCNQELWRRRGRLVDGAYLHNSSYAEDLLSNLPELNARFP